VTAGRRSILDRLRPAIVDRLRLTALRAARWGHARGLGHRPGLRGLAALAKRLLFRGSAARRHARVAVHGLELEVPYNLSGDYLLKDHEPETVALLERALAPGQVFVDVGANIGYLTLLAAARVGPAGRVVAVEPGPDNLHFLRRNLEVNGFANVRVVAAAAGACRTEATLHLSPVSTIHSLHAPAEPGAGSSSIAVAQVRLDELLEAPPDLVKIDVEGAELEVLAGMTGWLEAGAPPALVVEWNPRALRAAGVEPGELPRALERLGYALELLDPVPVRPGSVERALELLAAGGLPAAWYANLHARRASPPA